MAGPMLRIDLGRKGESFTDIAERLGATDEQIDKALASTLGKISRWLLTQSVKTMSADLRIQQKILRRRIKTFRMQGETGSRQAKVWYGLKAIDFADLHPKKAPGGVMGDGGRFEAGAFIGRSRRSGRIKVFKRRTDKPHPLEVITAKVSDEAEDIIERKIIGHAAFDDELTKIFTRELRWRTTT